jgi:hypothetical protein
MLPAKLPGNLNKHAIIYCKSKKWAFEGLNNGSQNSYFQ